MNIHPSLLRLSGRDGGCVYVNRAWQDFTGHLPPATLAEGWLEAVHPDDVEACRATSSESATAGSPFTLMYRLRNRGGEYHWFLEQGSPLFGPRGVYCGHSAASRQVSSSPRKGGEKPSPPPGLIPEYIVATATHDLMQPLRASELMLGKLAAGRLGEPERDLVQRLQIAMESMHGMISCLEDSGKGLRQEYCFLGDIATRAGLLHEPVATARQLSLQVFVQALPVVSNAILLERIVNNLLDNAIKYTRHGRVVLAVRPAGTEARLQVWDTGIGMAAAEVPGAFGAFSRLSGHDAQGSGLGLYNVRRLCDILGHQLTVQSRPGKGSMFEIRLPRADTYLGTGGLRPRHELYSHQ
jgi:anti-sigma regulatory factor (Ser/Thr protein kinase)